MTLLQIPKYACLWFSHSPLIVSATPCGCLSANNSTHPILWLSIATSILVLLSQNLYFRRSADDLYAHLSLRCTELGGLSRWSTSFLPLDRGGFSAHLIVFHTIFCLLKGDMWDICHQMAPKIFHQRDSQRHHRLDGSFPSWTPSLLWLEPESFITEFTCRNSVLKGDWRAWPTTPAHRRKQDPASQPVGSKAGKPGVLLPPRCGLWSLASLSWLWTWRQQEGHDGLSLGEN